MARSRKARSSGVVGTDRRRKEGLEKGPEIFKQYRIEKGEAASAMAKAERIVAGTYRFGHQEQAYIENNGVIAEVDGKGCVIVRGSMQCPYYVHKALKRLFRATDPS